MPFYEISSDGLSKLMPKSLCQVTSDSAERLKLESNFNAAVKEVNMVREENKELKEFVTALQRLASAEQSRLHKEERQALLSAKQTEKIREALTDEKEKTKALTKELDEERDRRDMYQEACDERLSMINTFRQTLSVKEREYSALRQVLDRNRDASEDTISKLNSKIKELQTKLAAKQSSQSKCKNCGRSDCGHPNNCAAYFNICKNCKSQGHYTKCCEFICDKCGEEEYHPPNSCIRSNGYSTVCGNLADTRSGHRNSRSNTGRRQGRRH